MLHLKTRYQPKKLRAILSLLLAFAFIAISGLQILHTHNHESLKGEADDTECVYASEKCVICDYITHKQAHPAHIASPLIALMSLPETIMLQSKTFADIFKSTLHGFSNKAPPVKPTKRFAI